MSQLTTFETDGTVSVLTKDGWINRKPTEKDIMKKKIFDDYFSENYKDTDLEE